MHPCHEHAADLRLDLASTDAKLPATLRSLLELLGTMSVPEAACELRIAKSTAYRWRRSLRERLGHLLHSAS
jgi:transposase-like protein